VTRLLAGRPEFDSWQGHGGAFCLRHRIQTSYGADPAYIMVTWGKEAGT